MNSILQAAGLRFADPSVESAFVDRYLHRHRVAMQVAMVVGGIIFSVFYIMDRIIDPDRWQQALNIRVMLVSPLVWSCAALVQIPRFRPYLEYFVTATLIIPVIGLAVVATMLNHGFDYMITGVFEVLIFPLAIAPIRLKFFLAFVAISLVAFLGIELLHDTSRTGIIFTNALNIGTGAALGTMSIVWRERVARSEFAATRALDKSRVRIDELLHSMLPAEIVDRIQSGETRIAEAHGEVSIVFADLVGFTELSRRVSPTHLVDLLNRFFSEFDKMAELHGLDRIKTIGDAYMAVGGLATNGLDHAEAAARFALEAQDIVSRLAEEFGYPLNLRIGLHIGPVVAGVIGTKRPAFDCWGEAVNLASRLEGAAQPGAILLSESAFWRLRGRFNTSALEDVELKGVGRTKIFLLEKSISAATA